VAFHTYHSRNSLDILFWLVAAYVLVGLAEHAATRRWVLLGLGLLNKTSVLWLGAGTAACLLLTDLRSHLRTRGPYLIRYARTLGVEPSTTEAKALAELPQFYPDMHGWEEPFPPPSCRASRCPRVAVGPSRRGADAILRAWSTGAGRG
jgi:hypothetical protein